MGEFFKGWRRKAGLVTLAMACLLAVAWMRSYVVRDVVTFTRSDRLHMIVSSHSHASWWAMANVYSQMEWNRYSIPPTERGRNSHLAHFRLMESTIASVMLQSRPPQGAIWTVPYWSLVLPLTLLSAWLILGKTRKYQPPSTSDPRC